MAWVLEQPYEVACELLSGAGVHSNEFESFWSVLEKEGINLTLEQREELCENLND